MHYGSSSCFISPTPSSTSWALPSCLPSPPLRTAFAAHLLSLCPPRCRHLRGVPPRLCRSSRRTFVTFTARSGSDASSERRGVKVGACALFQVLLPNRSQKEFIILAMEQGGDEQDVLGGDEKMSTIRQTDDTSKRKCGVCYLSRVPPGMGPSQVRQVLSQYGEVLRIYIAPKDAESQVQRKQSGGFRGKDFLEGWVEFAKKSIAKRVAKLLNGEQIGGKRRSSFFYDIWNIRYLHKFKWDDLIAEQAIKKREREEKLKLEISAAKKERDFYLSKVEQSKITKTMRERQAKKQKVEGSELSAPDTRYAREFPQNKPVSDGGTQSKRLSEDILAGIFGGSSS